MSSAPVSSAFCLQGIENCRSMEIWNVWTYTDSCALSGIEDGALPAPQSVSLLVQSSRWDTPRIHLGVPSHTWKLSKKVLKHNSKTPWNEIVLTCSAYRPLGHCLVSCPLLVPNKIPLKKSIIWSTDNKIGKKTQLDTTSASCSIMRS